MNTHYYIDGSTFLHVLPDKSKQVVFIIRLIRTTKALQKNQVVLFGYVALISAKVESVLSIVRACLVTLALTASSQIRFRFQAVKKARLKTHFTAPSTFYSRSLFRVMNLSHGRCDYLVRLTPLGSTQIAPRHNPPLDPPDAFLEIPILPRTDCSLSRREVILTASATHLLPNAHVGKS